jgi:hypothetical protein
MKVNASTFFTFCANHVALLRGLSEREGEISESEVFRLIRANAAQHEELPETTWRRLKELQVLVASEPGSASYLMADPVSRLLTYLFDDATPATPEMVRGYVESLDALGRKLSRAIEADDVAFVGLAFTEINSTLRRIHGDLDETQRAVQNEVASFKVNRQQVSVRERFRRIVYWMERFIEPMVEIVRPDGPLAAAFEETERLLGRAREQSLFNDHPALERNLRFLRLVRQHALRVFQDCRKELQPLYESLRRSSFIAAGAALALEKLQKEGLGQWGSDPVIGVCQARVQNVPGDAAIGLALRRVAEHKPEPAPVIALGSVAETPPGLSRQLWLETLPEEAAAALPIPDLLGWLAKQYPRRSTSEIVGGFALLVFSDRFHADFAERDERHYATADGALHGHPLLLESKK